MSIELVMPSNRLILCSPLLLLPSFFPSIKVFSNESVFCIRWSKYLSFSFSINPSNEFSGLISFRIDWFDLHNCPRDSQESSLKPKLSSKHAVSCIRHRLVIQFLHDSIHVRILLTFYTSLPLLFFFLKHKSTVSGL